MEVELEYWRNRYNVGSVDQEKLAMLEVGFEKLKRTDKIKLLMHYQLGNKT